jgi:hypothetical protein
MIIAEPSLGMLNLLGDRAAALVAQDQAELRPIFHDRIEAATSGAPRCDVLFLYCDLDGQVRVLPELIPLRDLVRQAGARVVVLASELPKSILNPQFSKVIGPASDWPANVAFTLDRKGDAFSRFFRELFSLMLAGTNMLNAWVELVPQVPNQPNDGPVMIMVPEIGHLAFALKRPSLRLV